MGHVARAFELDRHHRDHLLHRLEGRELHAELLALADVRDGHLEHRVGAADEIAAQQRREHRAQPLEPGPHAARRSRRARVAGSEHVREADPALPILRERRRGSTVDARRRRAAPAPPNAAAVARRHQERVGRHALQDAALLAVEPELLRRGA